MLRNDPNHPRVIRSTLTTGQTKTIVQGPCLLLLYQIWRESGSSTSGQVNIRDKGSTSNKFRVSPSSLNAATPQNTTGAFFYGIDVNNAVTTDTVEVSLVVQLLR